ncbi:hypothetical protein [Phytohabitans houttuyneae]|nr:hypothetical protein [Phytohabitans houttuyneae]
MGAFFRRPFTVRTLRRLAYALLSPFAAVLLFVPLLAGAGGGLERARARLVPGPPLPPPARPAWPRSAGYALASLPTGLLVGAFFGYLCLLLPYWVSYPVVYWGDDLSENWGGPSWLGAAALHFAPAPVMLFVGPWLLKLATSAQVGLARRFLSEGRVTIAG